MENENEFQLYDASAAARIAELTRNWPDIPELPPAVVRIRLFPLTEGKDQLDFLKTRVRLSDAWIDRNYSSIFSALSAQETEILRILEAIANGSCREENISAFVKASNERRKTLDLFRIAYRYTGVC